MLQFGVSQVICTTSGLRWTVAGWANFDYTKVIVIHSASFSTQFCPSLARAPRTCRPAGRGGASRTASHSGKRGGCCCLGQAGMRWGEGQVGLGLLSGPWLWRWPVSLRNPQRNPGAMRWKMRATHGALLGHCVLGDPAPLNPLGPCPG